MLKQFQMTARDKVVIPRNGALDFFAFQLSWAVSRLVVAATQGEKDEVRRASYLVMMYVVNVLWELEIVPSPERSRGEAAENLETGLVKVVACQGEIAGLLADGFSRKDRNQLIEALYGIYFNLAHVWFFLGIKEEEVLGEAE